MKKDKLILLAAAAVVLAGCGNPGGGFSMQQLLDKVNGADDGELVKQMFQSPDPDLRREAIEQLSHKKHYLQGRFLDGYAALAEDPVPTVRSAAVRALGRAGNPEYFKTLVEALGDEDAMVRWDAAVALDSVITPQATQPLAGAALNDPSADVRSSAARALRHYRRADVLETLLLCLEDPQFAVRFRASESLAELTGEKGGTDPRQWRRILSGKPNLFGPTPPAKS